MWVIIARLSTNTKPEIIIRRELHKIGYRFRVHVASLPGSPDIVFKKHGVAIQVMGCFWHGHKNCPRGRLPKSNTNYWNNKISKNILRDKSNIRLLKRQGWRVIVVWECKCSTSDKLRKEIARIMNIIDKH